MSDCLVQQLPFDPRIPRALVVGVRQELEKVTADSTLLNSADVNQHLGGSKTVILLGIAFDKASRTISDWQHEMIPK